MIAMLQEKNKMLNAKNGIYLISLYWNGQIQGQI